MTTLSLSRLRSLRLRDLPVPRIAPATRIAAGLVALIMSSLLLLDIAIGLIPNREADLLRERKHSAEGVAVLMAQLLTSNDQLAVARALREILAHRGDLLSAAVRRGDGNLLVQVGEHTRHWVPIPAGQSTVDHARVALRADGQHWADVELAFKPTYASVWQRWLGDPLVRLMAALGIGGFVAFSLYLRRVLSYLDPSAVIPDRVRAAFDTFTEGVMVLDTQGRIMLVNQALAGWLGEDSTSLVGKDAHRLRALKHVCKGNPEDLPWKQAISLKRSLTGDMMELLPAAGGPRKTVVNSAPILDGRRGVRGCMVTFDDVSALEQANQSLLEVLTDLEQSRALIEKQNDELRTLATRDPLTGCLNRRAFFESAGGLLNAAHEKGEPLHCIMSDIDHFKSFNDKHGHAVGDQVLQAVSKQLFSGLRDADLLCRYGGEEFCIFLPGVNTEQAQAIAERLRSEIEAQAGAAVRSKEGLSVTSSFGLAELTPELQDPAKLLERADVALYQAKRSGRNRVVTWAPGLEGEKKPEAAH
ncbi:MAG: diguanylate cyclase [Burkholderiales bacterium]